MDLTNYYFYPTIIAFSPTTATTGIGVLPTISVEFSMGMELTQFSSTINNYILLVEQGSGNSVDVEYGAYDTATNTLTFTPSADLTNGSYYQVTVLDDVQSDAGRTMELDFSWVFQVNSGSLDQVTLVAPANDTSQTTIPTLVWSAVTSALNYDVQVATSLEFNTESLLYNSATSAVVLPLNAETYPEDDTYYWKVRATSGTIQGPWSDYRKFYYGTYASPAIASRVTYPRESAFGVITALPADKTSNQSTWPTISATFSDTVASGTVNSTNFDVTYGPVDGDPSGNTGTVAGTLTTTGTLVTFTPTDPIVENTKYTITITDIQSVSGDTAAAVSYYFTSNYVPYYIGYAKLRARFGEFLSDYSIDFINRQILLSSIECNRMFWDLASSSTSALKQHLGPITYDMTKFVTAHAAYALLRLKRYELINDADTRKQLAGDFTVDKGSSILTELGKILEDLTDELEEIIATLGHQVEPVVGVRSGSWNPTSRLDDTSLVLDGMFKQRF